MEGFDVQKLVPVIGTGLVISVGVSRGLMIFLQKRKKVQALGFWESFACVLLPLVLYFSLIFMARHLGGRRNNELRELRERIERAQWQETRR